MDGAGVLQQRIPARCLGQVRLLVFPGHLLFFFAMIATVAAVSYYLVAHAIKGVQFSTPRQSVHLAVMKSSLMSLLV